MVKARAIVVLGVGNILLSDDGLGVRALERFGEIYCVPKGVSLIDGGTGGLALVSVLEGKRLVIIFDALGADDIKENKGSPPGKVVRLDTRRSGGAIIEGRDIRSLHDIGMAEVLAISSFQSEPPDVIIIGMTVCTLEPGLELSPVVAAGLTDMAIAAAHELRGAGINIKRRG